MKKIQVKNNNDVAMAEIDYKKAYNRVLQTWPIECLKMHKISNKVITFVTKGMQNRNVELILERETLALVKIQKGILQGNSLSQLLFFIAMMPLNYIHRKHSGGYKFTKSQRKIYYLMYMDDIKLFTKSEKELETLIQTIRVYSQDIGIKLGIEKYAMLIMKSRKRKMTEGCG